MPEGFTHAPQWGLTVGLLGKVFIFGAIASFLVAAVAAASKRERFTKIETWMGAVFTALAMGALIALLMGRQYEFRYVWQNTSNEMPEIYRFAAAWASQEGSFLLWAVTSACIAAIVAPFTGVNRRWFTIISSLALVFMLGILAYESPFVIHPELLEARHDGAILMPPDGRGLNPILMNYWMAIHPWVIFIGFGSLLSSFSWAGASIIRRDAVSWLKPARPFALFSMTMLGAGLLMGGLWAYETLGWGGFWAWDPVENVSLVPFLAAVALIHGMYLQSHRGAWARWNLFFGILPFAWFVYGTYLTRSGALVNISVHSFAEMNQGAHGILLAMVCLIWASVVIGAVVAFSSRSLAVPDIKPEGARGVGMKIGVIIMYSIALMASFGMSLPFFAALFAFETKIVEQDRYNQIVAWPFIPAMLLMAIVPFMGWTKRPARSTAVSNALMISVIFAAISVYWLVTNGMTVVEGEKLPFFRLALYYFLMWVTLFAICANGYRIYERVRARTWHIGPYITHAGVSLLLLGLIVSRSFEKTERSVASTTQPATFTLAPGKNYLAQLDPNWAKTFMTNEFAKPDHKLRFTLLHIDDSKQASFNPIFYFSERAGNWIAMPYIMRAPLYDLYFFVTGIVADYGKLELKPGETKETSGFSVTFVKPTMIGEPGTPGTKFGAELIIRNEGREKTVTPMIVLGEGGRIERPFENVFEDLNVVLESLDATTKTAGVSLFLPEPFFAAELFYKPLTILVWIGAGMMTLGGFMTANRRRLDAKRLQEEADATDSTSQG